MVCSSSKLERSPCLAPVRRRLKRLRSAYNRGRGKSPEQEVVDRDIDERTEQAACEQDRGSGPSSLGPKTPCRSTPLMPQACKAGLPAGRQAKPGADCALRIRRPARRRASICVHPVHLWLKEFFSSCVLTPEHRTPTELPVGGFRSRSAGCCRINVTRLRRDTLCGENSTNVVNHSLTPFPFDPFPVLVSQDGLIDIDCSHRYIPGNSITEMYMDG